jgi:hypothetical protein
MLAPGTMPTCHIQQAALPLSDKKQTFARYLTSSSARANQAKYKNLRDRSKALANWHKTKIGWQPIASDAASL